MLLDRSFRRTLLAGLPPTAAALLIAAPGCGWLAEDDIRCFEWPDELGACLDREQALEELNLIHGRCSDWIVSVESDAKQRDGACCYEVISRSFSPRCPMVGGVGVVGGSGPDGRSESSGGQSEGGGGQSEGGGGQSEGGGGQSAGGGGGQSAGGGGPSEGGGGRF